MTPFWDALRLVLSAFAEDVAWVPVHVLAEAKGVAAVSE
jgi:hypothetical protein